MNDNYEPESAAEITFRMLNMNDANKIRELALAVLNEDNGRLEHKVVTIREKSSRPLRLVTKQVDGIPFGSSGLHGVIIPNGDGVLIASSVRHPWRHRKMYYEWSVYNFLFQMASHRDDIENVVDLVAWDIERLLPDGHKYKRLTPPELAAPNTY